jgi:hypothetical protein
VAEQVVESIDDIKAQAENVLGRTVKVDIDFIESPVEFGAFTGWTYRDGTRGKGFYKTIYKNSSFVPSDNDRGTIAGWVFQKGVLGLGYYAVSIGQSIKDQIAKRIANVFGYTKRKTV